MERYRADVTWREPAGHFGLETRSLSHQVHDFDYEKYLLYAADDPMPMPTYHDTHLVVREERVPLDVEELALVRMRQLGRRPRHVLGRVQAERLVEPALDGVARGVPDQV